MAKSLTLTQEQLDAVVAAAVEKALEGRKPAKVAEKVTNEAISEEEVAQQSGEFFYNIKEAMIARNSDGSIKLGVGKKGQDVVILKKGFDYGIYRFVKGVARQLGHMSRDGNWVEHTDSKLTQNQIVALYNVLNRENMAELFAEEAEEVKPEPKKVGRSKKSAA